MDVTGIIAAETAKQSALEVEKDIPVEIDAGLLSVTDMNHIDAEAYAADREAYLAELAREGVQLLLSKLFSLPVSSSPEGPLAQLPKPTTLLPRAKPLPKPKPPTKWEKFAAAKGINKQKKEKKVWDEESQEWVNRWGRDGKNKEKEEQWIQVLPDQAPDDHNPAAAAKAARKQRVAKNEAQHQTNLARAERSERKTAVEKSLLTTKASTASMGRFDRKLEGEPKARGIKRKFEPNEQSVENEKKASLAILSKLDGSLKSRKDPSRTTNDTVLNVRKAIRFASNGRGAAALGRDLDKNVRKKAGKTK